MSETIRAVIVDDEPAAREVVRTMLAEYPSVTLVGEATNGNEAIGVIRRENPDLLLLDVQMPDRDGFGVLDALGDAVPRGVVFVTAHDEHAVRAFEVHALDYLLKPFGRPRFNAAMTRVLERLTEQEALTLQRTLASMADDRRAGHRPIGDVTATGDESGASGQNRIAVRSGSKLTLVDVDSIDWVEADGDYARIHAGKQSHLVGQRMHALERILEKAGFIRIHRSLIVRGARVRELHRDADGGGFIVLRDGVRLRVARNRWEDLTRALHVLEI